MKKILLIIVAGLFMITSACKKGENDPFLSLKSRKARLAGIYEFTSLEFSSATLVEGEFMYYTNTDIKIEEGTGTKVITNAFEEGGEITDTKIKDIQIDKGEFIIDKDGTWEFTLHTTATWEEEGGGVNDHFEYNEIQTINESGDWIFLDGKPNSFKNKERVLFSKDSYQASVQTNMKVIYIDGSSSDWPGEKHTVSYNEAVEAVYEIDGLKNKEMSLKRPNSGSKTEEEADSNMPISLIAEGIIKLNLMEQ